MKKYSELAELENEIFFFFFFFLIEIINLFIFYIIYIWIIDGFFRILEKTSSELVYIWQQIGNNLLASGSVQDCPSTFKGHPYLTSANRLVRWA